MHKSMGQRKTKKRDKRMMLALSEEEQDYFDAAAEALGWTRSELIRVGTLKFLADGQRYNAKRAEEAGDLESAQHAKNLVNMMEAAMEKAMSSNFLRERTQRHRDEKKKQKKRERETVTS